jgi:hypothetical protein
MPHMDATTSHGAVLDADLAHWLDVGDAAQMPGRLVLSPEHGDWQPGAAGDMLAWREGPVAAGEILGTVAGRPVRSPIAGRLAGVMVLTGERLRTDEPIAWVVPA